MRATGLDVFWAVSAIPLLTMGCDSAGQHAAGRPTTSQQPLECPEDCGEACLADSAELFASEAVPRFEFTLPEEDWEALKQNARDEQYTQACLSFEGQNVGTVGLRFKGSYGTLYACVDNQGNWTCPKLSMKAKFDYVDDERRFFGLKRLNLHSMLYDSSKLKERLAYDLYREMGVVSPRSAWAMVFVNGEPYGLTSMVEQIDGRFTKHRWPDDGDGNLYKEAWPAYPSGSYFAERLRTNEEAGDTSGYVRFATELLQAEPDARFEVLERYTNPELLYRYMAVDDAIANVDGVTAYYTAADGSWSGNHNFYMYHEPEQNKFRLIPWDVDSTFSLWANWNRVPHWSQTPEDCDAKYSVWSGDALVLAPGCDPVFQALSTDLAPYQSAIDELLSGPFAETSINEKIDLHAAFLEPAVAADATGGDVQAWREHVAGLRSNFVLLRQRLENLRDQLPVVPFSLGTDGVNDFEAANELLMALGSELYSNAATTVRQLLNTSAPLAGSRDLRLDFEFRNEQEPWDQWIAYGIAIEGGIQDLSGVTGIRLRLLADGPRSLRIELHSQANSLAHEGIRRGWEVDLDAEATSVELAMHAAEVQSWAVEQGRDPSDPLEAILKTVEGLVFKPNCEKRDLDGYLPEGTTETGFIQIDDIEFYTAE